METGIVDFNLLMLTVALLLGAGFMWFLMRAWSRPKKIQKRSRFLLNAERALYQQLSEALSDEYLVFPKVAMSDVVEVDAGISGLSKSKAVHFLRDERFDFVICNRQSMAIYAVVELEHSKAVNNSKSSVGSGMVRKQKQKNELVNKLCESAKLRVFYFDARQADSYKDMNLCRLITGRAKKKPKQVSASSTHQSQLSVDSLSHTVLGAHRTCPKCRSELVTKVSMKGSDIGEKYLMCRKYPYCDYRMSVSDLDSMNQMKQKEIRDASVDGYSKWA